MKKSSKFDCPAYGHTVTVHESLSLLESGVGPVRKPISCSGSLLCGVEKKNRDGVAINWIACPWKKSFSESKQS